MAAGTPGGLRGVPGSPLRALGRPLAAARAGAAPQVPPPLPRRALTRPRLRLPLAPRGGGHVRGSPRATTRAPSPPRLLLPPLSDPRPPAALNREEEPAGPRPHRSHWRLPTAGGRLVTPLAVSRRGPAGVWLSVSVCASFCESAGVRAQVLSVSGVRGACACMCDRVRLCPRCACGSLGACPFCARERALGLCPFAHACLSVPAPPVFLRGPPCPCAPLISGQPPCCGRVPSCGRGSLPAVPRCPPRLPAPLAGRCPRCWSRRRRRCPALPALLSLFLPAPAPCAARGASAELRRAPPRSPGSAALRAPARRLAKAMRHRRRGRAGAARQPLSPLRMRSEHQRAGTAARRPRRRCQPRPEVRRWRGRSKRPRSCGKGAIPVEECRAAAPTATPDGIRDIVQLKCLQLG
ncbi:uncharacterized protein LOC141728652 [Zonotrichia albicollis]|uniref:uncharacterized protein LOC141728652 n=1 Tax=Zonotrichia albicollis TaxID=44394 RepID=UPI003D810530